jgi:ectoine hydroxylase-related dioxygenase (phytanoyl-CoA dioxygenase family)
MNKIYNFSKQEYNFDILVSKLFQNELNTLHQIKSQNYEIFTEVGKDSDTEFHQKFYKKLNEPWDEIINLYKKFIKDIVLPIMKNITDENEFAYQTFPTFRVQLPNNVAVTKYHTDSDLEFKHPEGEINFIIPLTKMFDTNTIWAESEPDKGDFKALNLELGELLCWNFNKCHHGNKINETNFTRVSMDFRILPMSKYKNNNNIGNSSASSNSKFKIGNYYRYTSL